MSLERIVSSGQMGVDRGPLDSALATGQAVQSASGFRARHALWLEWRSILHGDGASSQGSSAVCGDA